MPKYLCLWLLAIYIVTAPALCEEVGYVFSDAGDFELSNVTVSHTNLTDTVTFTTAGPGGSYVSDKKIGELQKIFDQRIEAEKVHDDAMGFIASISGDHTIDQVCLIYERIKNGWSIKGDPRGADYYLFANETLRQGKEAGRLGAGDCDDFALLMASMIESIGGSTRVMLAYSPSGSHAYAEVYLGKMGSDNVNRLKRWLMLKYRVSEISAHWDKETGDVWLNLDWGKNIAVAAYPGSPFFDATEHRPIYIKNDTERYPLNPSPMALFHHPSQGNAGEPIVFDASESLDMAGIIEFEWDFGDGIGKARGPEYNVSYTYAKNGVYNVTLMVRDDQGAENSSTSTIHVNNPPSVEFTVSPEKPKIGDLVAFDSSPSNDSDGQIVERYWELDNLPNSREEITYKKYSKSCLYWVNLSVTDNKGARSTKSLHLRVNEPPVASFVPDRQDVNVGESIIFDASSSEDPDGGTLVNYTWDFGDGVPAENKSLVRHAFTSGGDKTVTLVVEDNDAAKSTATCSISVNNPPEAAFTYQIKEGNKIEFNASSSKDEEGEIASYKWDFNDHSGLIEASDCIMKHTYEEPGDYNVTLIVIDEKGSLSKISQIINLETTATEPATVVESTNEAPVAEFSYKVSPIDNHTSQVSFDATYSRDPDGVIRSYEWDFDDYSDIQKTGKNKIMHTYDKPGQYNVTLTVTDERGSTGNFSQTIDLQLTESTQLSQHENQCSVTNIIFNPSTPGIGETVLFDVLTSCDIDGPAVNYLWDFGDGTRAAGRAVSHAFGSPGSFRVTLTVVDNKGLSSSIATYIPVQTSYGSITGYQRGYVQENMTVENATIEENVTTGAGMTMPVGDTPVIIQSQGMRGYQVFLDGNYIGQEGTNGDPLDGVFSFRVTGDQYHDVRVYDGQLNYPKKAYFQKGATKKIYIDPGTTA